MSERIRVAIVDDEHAMRESIGQWLDLSGFETTAYESGNEALEAILPDFRGIVISDIRMPGLDGLSLLKRLQALDPALPVILITGHGDVPMAVEAMRLGAFDFVEKPFDPERLATLARKAVDQRRLTLDSRALRRELADGEVMLSRLMGNSPGMAKLREDILDIAQSDGHVLVTGETGTGKSVVAHALHACGPRQSKPFHILHCSSGDADHLARHLFGPGAEDGPPLISAAAGGTLCLEDVEVLPDPVQARLLAELTALEATDPTQKSSLRIVGVCGGNPDGIRRDLYYRLASMEIAVPPLRERGDDIATLFESYCERFAEDYGCEVPTITASDVAHLLQAPWTGNVRQLINLAERAVLIARREGETLTGLLLQEAMEASEDSARHPKALKDHVEAFERTLIENALKRHEGSVAAVMEDLSLPRRTLNEKMAKYGISRSDFV